MKKSCTQINFIYLLILLSLCLNISKATTFWNGDTYITEIPGGGPTDYLLKAKYSIFIPKGITTIRGIIIHQHGCGGESWGEPMATDAQYQAFAQKWNFAILGPDLYPKEGRNCYDWVFPEISSAASLLAGIDSLALQSGHSELKVAPWLLWGHSGGGHWVLSMTKTYPERIIATFAYSPAFDPTFEYPAEALKIPIMIRHAGANDFNIPGINCWGTALNTFSKLRSNNGLVSIAYNAGQNHNYSFVRYMAIPFFESVLQQRLSKDGSPSLKDMNQNLAWLVDTTTSGTPNIYKASAFTGNKLSMSWLPDSLCASKFKEYIMTGTVKDLTPPLPPNNLVLDKTGGNNILIMKWEAQADIESGIKYFNIYKDDILLSRYPENLNFQYFDTNGDIPVPAQQPILQVTIPQSGSLNIQALSVSTVNNAGLESQKCSIKFPVGNSKIQAVLYVSPNGNDKNPGTITLPFATIQNARDEVRKINKGMTGNIVVYLLGGTYNLDSSFVLTGDDSGTNGFNVIYQSFNCEKPVLSGGIKISGWSIYDSQKNIFKATIDKSIDTRQLYVNGVRAIRARSIDSTGWSESGDGYNCPSEVESWGNISNVEVVSRKEWKCHRGPIASISGTHAVMAQPYWDNLHQQYDAPPVWVENAYELLDSVGEWYLDPSKRVIYYKPRSGEDMASAEIILPKLDTMIYAVGAQNIHFKGLTFSHATWLLPNSPKGYPCVQSDIRFAGTIWEQNPGNIILYYCSNILFENNTFEHLGVTALQLYTGCKNNRISNNIFQDISGSAISIGNIITFSPSDNDLVKDNIVENNLICNIGEEYESSAGIFVPISEHTVITHNELRNLPHIGISIGWGWNNEYISGKNNEVSYNLIDSVVTTLRDGGGIYSLSSQPGASVHDNYIRHLFNGFGALYPDYGTSNMRWHHNVLQDILCWLSLWSDASKNDTIDYNYYDNQVSVSTGTNCAVQNNVFVPDGNWPDEAKTIMQNAGRRKYSDDANPEIMTQPRDTTILVGSQFILEVAVLYPSRYDLKYQWYKNKKIIEGAIGPVYMKNNADTSDTGEYYCEITSGCGIVNSKTVNISVSSIQTNIKDLNKMGFSIGPGVPNPTNEMVTFEFLLPKSGIVQIILSDIRGKDLKNLFEGLKPTGINIFEININQLNLTSGVYFCKIKYESISEIRKIVIIN